MRLIRFDCTDEQAESCGLTHSGPTWAVMQSEAVFPTALSVAELHAHLRRGEPIPRSSHGLKLDEVQLLAPAEPTKIVCIGLNYRHHAEEMNKTVPDEPLMFLKPPSALQHPNGPIVLPPESHEIHHEGELAVVIGERTRYVAPEQALDRVLGVTCFNDVTARDIQKRENKYTRGKGFDTFGPCGPCVAVGLDPQALTVTTRVDGQVRQRHTTDDMIWPVAELIAFVGRVMTLEPGDILTTGTPVGVGPIVEGETVTVEVSEVGVLSNPVVRLMTEA